MDHRTTELGRRLNYLSFGMCLLATLTFIVPGFLMLCPWGEDGFASAIKWMANIAFFISLFFAIITIGLFAFRLYDVIDVQNDEQRNKVHGVGILFIILIMIATMCALLLRFYSPDGFIMGSYVADHLLSSIIIAFILVIIDAYLIFYARQGRLKAEWHTFTTEATKLDAGVFVVFSLAGVFLFCALGHMPTQSKHELAPFVAGVEAVLLTVSTFAFAFDSGGLLKLPIPPSPSSGTGDSALSPSIAIEGSTAA